MGLITEDERHETIVNIWTEAYDEVGVAMQKNFNELNPVFMMANSGCPTAPFDQIRQLGMPLLVRGLMANPKGEIIKRTIKANFMEGLLGAPVLHLDQGRPQGTRQHGIRTADSGYLTRRLVSVSPDIVAPPSRRTARRRRPHRAAVDHPPRGLNKSLLGRVLAEVSTGRMRSGKPGRDCPRRGRTPSSPPRCSPNWSRSSGTT